MGLKYLATEGSEIAICDSTAIHNVAKILFRINQFASQGPKNFMPQAF
jgi:hypothetical protein